MACGELKISEIIHEAVTEILQKKSIPTTFLQSFTMLKSFVLRSQIALLFIVKINWLTLLFFAVGSHPLSPGDT